MNLPHVEFNNRERFLIEELEKARLERDEAFGALDRIMYHFICGDTGQARATLSDWNSRREELRRKHIPGYGK